MSRVYIVLRQSPDWASLSDVEFRRQSREFCRLIGRPIEQVNMSVDLWNRTLRRPFCEVRQEIKKIALENFARAEDAEIVDGAGISRDFHFAEGFYLFTDDDDWVNPGIASLLSGTDNAERANCFIWGSAVFGTPWLKNSIIERRKIVDSCHTNNYAVTGEYLAESPEHFKKVYQHFSINRLLEQQRAAVGIRVINAYWSISNKNPSSTLFLEQLLQGEYSSPKLLIGAVESYLQRSTNIDNEIDPTLAWARPLMDKMVRLFTELL